MIERVIRTNEAGLATEAFGDPAHAPLLLLMGGMASMLWWPDEFCLSTKRLPAKGLIGQTVPK